MNDKKSLFLLLLFSGIFIFPVYTASKKPVKAKKGMVVTAEPIASEIGIEILKSGGNAIDAAVAVGFALAVTFPQAGNIGGGGFMVIRMADGRTTAIDYRERAPIAATRDMYLDERGNFLPTRSQEGHLSVGVPGSVAGLLYALEHYGTKTLKKVIQPAISVAEKGFILSQSQSNALNSTYYDFLRFPSSKKVFTKAGDRFKEGDTLNQEDLAGTLRRILRKGKEGFYKGKTAELIVKEMKRGNGIITLKDLEEYTPIERKPIIGTYRDYEIISMGPSSSGGVAIVQLLNLLEGFDLPKMGFLSSTTISVMAETMKLVYADRAEYLGDSDFYGVPVEWLISKKYADVRRKLINTEMATPSIKISFGKKPSEESEYTTHYSIIDSRGNAVSVTTTINSSFGSKVVVDGAGFLLNNEMDDFSAKPGIPNQFGLIGGEANSIQPRKRMLSAMTPTIVTKDGKLVIIVGSPGGSTIISTVLQVLVNIIDFGMNIQEAIDAPRIHHQWLPDTLYYERRSLANDILINLGKKGYNLLERNGYQGRVDGIIIDNKKGIIYGATDPRGDGEALGY